MFDPNLGRFTQPDPIGFESEDANLYRYVENNPTNSTDPSGLDPAWGDLAGAYGEEWRLVQDALTKPEGAWDADWYFTEVLDLRSWAYLGFADSEEYSTFSQGCMGLCGLRLGLGPGHHLHQAEKCFKDFDSALKYAKDLPTKSGKKARIFAFLCRKLQISTEEWGRIQSEVSKPYELPNVGEGFDYCTLHQIAQDQDTWFWESMNHGCRTPGAKVKHRPFTWLLPENLTDHTSHKYVMFCVVYANDNRDLLPTTTNYGK